MNYLEVVKLLQKVWSFGNCSYANDLHLHTHLDVPCKCTHTHTCQSCKSTYFTWMSLRCRVRKLWSLVYLEMVLNSFRTSTLEVLIEVPQEFRGTVKGLLWAKCNVQIQVLGNNAKNLWECIAGNAVGKSYYNYNTILHCDKLTQTSC